MAAQNTNDIFNPISCGVSGISSAIGRILAAIIRTSAMLSLRSCGLSEHNIEVSKISVP